MWRRERKTDSAEARRAAEYATPEEFCAIFERDMDALYTLAYALTADHAKAEECFLGALDDCRKAKVFRNWEQSWTRLSVIERAIRAVKPLSVRNLRSVEPATQKEEPGLHPEVLPFLRLNAFDRFVFVLTVLDRYSVRDCAILLKCSVREVDEARRRAMASFGEQALPIMPTIAQALPTPIRL